MDQTHEEKLAKAIEYLRARGKYLLDEGCEFRPSAPRERIDILKKYGSEPAKEDEQ